MADTRHLLDRLLAPFRRYANGRRVDGWRVWLWSGRRGDPPTHRDFGFRDEADAFLGETRSPFVSIERLPPGFPMPRWLWNGYPPGGDDRGSLHLLLDERGEATLCRWDGANWHGQFGTVFPREWVVRHGWRYERPAGLVLDEAIIGPPRP